MSTNHGQVSECNEQRGREKAKVDSKQPSARPDVAGNALAAKVTRRTAWSTKEEWVLTFGKTGREVDRDEMAGSRKLETLGKWHSPCRVLRAGSTDARGVADDGEKKDCGRGVGEAWAMMRGRGTSECDTGYPG